MKIGRHLGFLYNATCADSWVSRVVEKIEVLRASNRLRKIVYHIVVTFFSMYFFSLTNT